MTRKSQDLYKHSITKDYSTQPRISITFRLLNPPANPSYVMSPSSPSPSVPPAQIPSTDIQQQPRSSSVSSNSNVTTIYISSSMFRNLNSSKLSTDTQKAAVFFYPGATAGAILDRLNSDSDFRQINPQYVKRIYLLCGTNNVDNILHIPRSMDKSIVEDWYTNFSNKKLSQTKLEMKNLISNLNEWAPAACVNVLNILPRESNTRNRVINELNCFISEYSASNNNVEFISTELDRHLFCNRVGYRNSNLFNFNGEDNVHLNTLGKSKLAKFLKYHAHNISK